MGIKNAFKKMSLHRAAKDGDVESLRYLAARGVDVNAEDGHRTTLLTLAVKNGRIDAVRSLIDQGANVNPDHPWGFTPLVHALEKGHVEVVRLLLEKGADANARPSMSSQTATPLTTAARYSTADMLRLLLDYGAEPDAENGDSGTALLAATRAGNVEGVRLLVDRGANIHTALPFFRTAEFRYRGSSGADWVKIKAIFDEELAAEKADRLARHPPHPHASPVPRKKPPGFML